MQLHRFHRHRIRLLCFHHQVFWFHQLRRLAQSWCIQHRLLLAPCRPRLCLRKHMFLSTSTPFSLATSWPLTLPSVASSLWLPIPCNPSNPWLTCSVAPSTASPSSAGSALAFSVAPCPSSSSSWQSPFYFDLVPSGVATPTATLDPILQQAATCQDPILHGGTHPFWTCAKIGSNDPRHPIQYRLTLEDERERKHRNM